jgi:hypothetical protein
MGVRSKALLGVTTLAVFSTILIDGAIAQDASQRAPSTVEAQPIDDAFLDAFYTRGGTFYQNRRPPRNVTWMIGPFPENDILADADAVNRLYRVVLEQQGESDPYLRTPDLTNPYDTSLQLLPPYEPSPIPPVEPFYFPLAPGVAPVAPQNTAPSALW